MIYSSIGLGWDTALAYNKETFGEGSMLGRLNKKEVFIWQSRKT
ncbi:MAG: hypothetical protein Q7U86_07050 [Draconibacterium sp.]|nr:hypothetical protein [Draconibacterium sp.]